jgi:hypothetical protein
MIQNNFNNCQNVHVHITINVNGQENQKSETFKEIESPPKNYLILDCLCLLGIGMLKIAEFTATKAIPFIAKDMVVPFITEGVIPVSKWLGKSTLKGMIHTREIAQQYRLESKQKQPLLAPKQATVLIKTLPDGSKLYGNCSSTK